MSAQMTLVKHKFRDHQIQTDSEILIIGTFNPDTPKNNADFFYSRKVKRSNELWALLPTAILGRPENLVGLARVQEKKKFMKDQKLDFIDVIDQIEIPAGSENNVKDSFLDKHMPVGGTWRDVIGKMKELPKLKMVCFTRKGFQDIPNIKKKIEEIEGYCNQREIKFGRLVTPSPLYRNNDKQKEWTNFFQQDWDKKIVGTR